MSSRRVGVGTLLALGFAVSAVAQQFPFRLLVAQAGSAITVQNSGTLSLVAAVGQSQTAQLQATYTGTGQVTISQPLVVSGSTAFTATVAGALPLTLASGGSVSITIQFSPTSSSLSTAQISLPFLETLSSGSSNASSITLSLQGTAPALTLSYILQTDQNVVPLQSGGQIPFPATLVGSSVEAALNFSNTGSAPGVVTGITITGSAFTLQGIPLLPATVPAGQSLQVFVLYKPAAVGTDTGQVTVTFATGSPVTVNLAGSGSSPSFTYQLLNANPPTTVSPGGTIVLPNANVGQTSSLTIQVLNSGNASGVVSSIGIGGQTFQLSNLPVLPQTLAPNATLTFNLNFTPTQPGTFTGTLIINSNTFSLSGAGLGPLLTFSYVAAGATVTLSGTNNSVVFSPVTISQSEQLSLDVKNTGTLPATISNIGIGQSNGPYSLLGLPALPLTLAPNADFQIIIEFTPVTLGFSNGSLVLDGTTIALVGSGTQPPPLPSYTISGPSGNAAPMTQPSISLSLATAYPVAISGTLTLGVAGSLHADPAVQFASGGSTVSFMIPANQTSAVFGSQGTQIGLQTGTVASSITLTPSFATQAGNVNLTPAVPTVLQFEVAPASPTLIAVQLPSVSATGLTIEVTGFATTRSLTSWTVQFTAAKGFSLATSQFTIDVSQVSDVWFQSAASQNFGGQFTVTIPFTFAGMPSGQSVQSAIASVSVTISNSLGTSNSVQTMLQ
jgi:hypothetical protein